MIPSHGAQRQPIVVRAQCGLIRLQAGSDSSPASERPRTAVSVGARRSHLLARWPGTHSLTLSRIQRPAQTVLCVYLKRTCSRVTSASSALGVLNDYALYTHTLTHSLTHSVVTCNGGGVCATATHCLISCVFANCYSPIKAAHTRLPSVGFRS